MATNEVAPKTLAELLEEMETLVLHRIDEAEATYRRMRWLLGSAGFMVLLLVAAAGAILYASMRAGILGAGAHSISAREFILADADGTVRGSWTLTDEGAARLLLQDQNGVPRVKLAVTADGAPGLALTDEVGRSRIVLGILPDETSTMVFADQRGEARAILGLSMDEAVRLIFADRGGAVRAGLGVAANGAANLILDD